MGIGNSLEKCAKMKWISSSKKSSNFMISLARSKNNSESKDALYGSVGSFIHVKNDFNLQYLDANQLTHVDHLTGYEKRIGEDSFRCDGVQVRKPKDKFRFVVATLALFVVIISLMSRILLNVAIVEMTRSTRLNEGVTQDELESETSPTLIIYSEETGSTPNDAIVISTSVEPSSEEEEGGLDWSAGRQNLLLASFYFGYPPAIMLSGGLSDMYGSKIPLLICGLGSGMVSLLTPFAARYSLPLLICLRAMLGLFQGAIIPASYDLFNRWLTLTETSIFVPLIKVSFAFGTFLGALLPGLILHLGFDWPYFFYVGSAICFTWCIFWIPLATSEPQTNSLVSLEELNWIVRKKKQEEQVEMNELNNSRRISTISDKNNHLCSSNNNNNNNLTQPKTTSSNSAIWFLILCNPSVLALSLVKFTYNIGMDFVTLELATYLRQVHQAPMETISAITSGGCLIQMFLVTFVGWIAKIVIQRESFGLTKTKWRKIFQGSSNFIMAIMYLGLSLFGDQLWLATCFFMVVFFAWMLGAGGEAMIPYDLSSKYPATIIGIAQSIASVSGLLIPTICSIVLGEEMSNSTRWNTLFQIISVACALGGFVFVFVLKAKPFLPDELEAAKGEVKD